ncbi:methyltransferase domain-containing protein [Paenibacillus sonchi]|uniref:Methyltransferase domain-containing protein n=2 Tax=Paenibacillus sonchi TaxID=373687 RepID=A0A974PEY6_9BACL|nr:methyltransferase domain-containing protein [Paenibacillus sonchi]QQZ62148.1 methyltransferase domain-containing protein [Paenibacillus sonchi]
MKENSNHTKNILDELSRDKALLADKFDNLNEQIKQLINDKKQLTMENATLVQSIKELTEQQNRKNLGLTQNIEDFTKKLSLAFDHIGALKEQLSIEHNYQQEVKNVIDEKFESINELISFVKRKVKKIDSGAKIFKEKNKVNESSIEINAPIDQEVKYEMDYVLFENKFRGSRNTIKERQKQYLQYILPTDRVLDIGCGRGEFIELLTESGVTVEGIDLNEDMVEYCQDRGFNVKYADAIEYLINASPQSYDCISMCQVIEHLTFEQYTYLLSLILNALKPGGRVIIETINAQSVYAMSNWFYIDPTHTKPVHPETLDFVIKETGFNKTERKNVSPVEHINVPQINNIENSEEINRAIGDLYGMLYGYQDYAIIAWR